MKKIITSYLDWALHGIYEKEMRMGFHVFCIGNQPCFHFNRNHTVGFGGDYMRIREEFIKMFDLAPTPIADYYIREWMINNNLLKSINDHIWKLNNKSL